jgi:hypothetical protein
MNSAKATKASKPQIVSNLEGLKAVNEHPILFSMLASLTSRHREGMEKKNFR